MKQLTKTRILRKVLILTFLIAGIVIVASEKSICVGATTCEDAFNTFTNANWAYSDAFQSNYYGNPTTCQQDCSSLPLDERAQCITDCQTTRLTALGAAGIGLFSAAWATCTPATVEACDLARTMADTCTLQYNYADYPDPDQAGAIYAQYSSCRLASKIDSCQ